MIHKTFPVGPLHCNCTILGDEASHEAIVIDPGDNISQILLLLAENRLTLKLIIITHAHIDHVGGAAKLKRSTGAPVMMNTEDTELLSNLDVQAGWIGIAPPEIVAIDGNADHLASIRVAGLEAQVLHTPGHTPGSICLHFPADHLLFSGDTLFAGSIGRTDLPGGNTQQILRSIRDTLMPLPEATRIIPGHGASTTMGDEIATNPFLQRL